MEYVCAPQSATDWLAIAQKFDQIWNFPHCIGAIDGKHVVIQAPAHAGSYYFNYKGTHSVVLMAVADAQYWFILVDIGDAGRHSDGGAFSNSEFGQRLDNKQMHIPTEQPLPGTTEPNLPFVMVGDEAFPLKEYMLRPFPGRFLSEKKAIYNYRLSRARRVIENTFGILASRWRLFRKPIIAEADNVVKFTKAAVALHNYLRTEESALYSPPGYVDEEDGYGNVVPGAWRNDGGENNTGLSPIGNGIGGNRYTRTAADIRDHFANYLSSPIDEVSWQHAYINRTQ